MAETWHDSLLNEDFPCAYPWDILPGERILTYPERVERYSALKLDPRTLCARPKCGCPSSHHDIYGGACHSDDHCPQFLVPRDVVEGENAE